MLEKHKNENCRVACVLTQLDVPIASAARAAVKPSHQFKNQENIREQSGLCAADCLS
jgi:hypothetical protein